MPSKRSASPRDGGREDTRQSELVIITGLSGSGKGSVLKALEDLGYYSVDNMPVELIPKFADLIRESPSIGKAALVVDIREREGLRRFPTVYQAIRQEVRTKLLFLDAEQNALVRRFSETRRPHPLGTSRAITGAIQAERRMLAPIRSLADHIINTSKFNVHELREAIRDRFTGEQDAAQIMVYVTSFGYRHGVPADSDLVFDVRFLPNPNYIPKFRDLTGRHEDVASYILSFPQTTEFIDRISELLIYLLPHYVREGKSYLTISFGCTGGHHRSVMIAEAIRRKVGAAGYRTKVTHRDTSKPV